jgi:alpha-ketoglutarate-dependent taurine dioxygenase
MLVEQSIKPAFVYTHEHRLGDMLLWDNRSALHRADTDYKISGERHRVLYRIVCAPEKPV